MISTPLMNRRRVLAAAIASPLLPLLLPGCAAPLPVSLNTATTPAAQALLAESAAAHGLAALARIDDVAIGTAGAWRPLIGRLQPALADPGFRGGSQERLLLRGGLVVQAHTGPSGAKRVLRRPGIAPGSQGTVAVWFNGEEAGDVERRAAAALVVDGYSLFLLGPMLLAGRWSAERTLAMEIGGVEAVNGLDCDVLRVSIAPGLGFSPSERLALFIDRRERLMRKVRFSLDGLASTVGAVAEVETYDWTTVAGVRWPTRFYERLLRPLPLPVHDWRLTGLDVNRGLAAADVDGAAWSARALVPAAALAT
jgi:hypothetical protein